MRTLTAAHRPLAAAPAGVPAWFLDDHHRSLREFSDTCHGELALPDRLSMWTEWLDRLLARRFATSIALVGGFAGLVLLVA